MNAIPLDQVFLAALAEELSSLLPYHNILYHYNPGACIEGPVIFSHMCKIMFYEGKILVFDDLLPLPSLKPPNKIIAAFDIANPSFVVTDVATAIDKYNDKFKPSKTSKTFKSSSPS